MIGQLFARLRVFEEQFGVSITISDSHGRFVLPSGQAMLGQAWQSHKKNKACRLGFGNRCVDHCRHAITARGAASAEPFVHTCWKGLCEVACPLYADGLHLGTLFAGLWRARDKRPPDRGMPAAFAAAYRGLPLFSSAKAEALKSALPWVATGLLTEMDQIVGLPRGEQDLATTIRRFLRQRLHQPLRLADLASHLHRSPGRTSHLVTEVCGKPFQRLLLETRIRAARGLLQDPDRKVQEIASQVGFGNVCYFSRAFKQETGVSPRAYRKALR